MTNNIKLNFGEKELEFFFGLSFLGYFYEKYDLDVAKMYEKLSLQPFKYIPLIMFESYKHNLERQGKKAELSELQLSDLIDENGGLHDAEGNASKFVEAFFNSLMTRLPKAENEGNDTKKNKLGI